MPNHKTGWPSQNSYPIQLVLTTPTTTGADAFEKAGVLYQVPSGLRFYCTMVQYHALPTAVGYMRLFSADTENAETTLLQQFRVDGETEVTEPINYIFETGKFITGRPTTASEFDNFFLFGYEAT